MEKQKEVKIDDCFACIGTGRFAGKYCVICNSTGKITN